MKCVLLLCMFYLSIAAGQTADKQDDLTRAMLEARGESAGALVHMKMREQRVHDGAPMRRLMIDC